MVKFNSEINCNLLIAKAGEINKYISVKIGENEVTPEIWEKITEGDHSFITLTEEEGGE